MLLLLALLPIGAGGVVGVGVAVGVVCVVVVVGGVVRVSVSLPPSRHIALVVWSLVVVLL